MHHSCTLAVQDEPPCRGAGPCVLWASACPSSPPSPAACRAIGARRRRGVGYMPRAKAGRVRGNMREGGGSGPSSAGRGLSAWGSGGAPLAHLGLRTSCIRHRCLMEPTPPDGDDAAYDATRARFGAVPCGASSRRFLSNAALALPTTGTPRPSGAWQRARAVPASPHPGACFTTAFSGSPASAREMTLAPSLERPANLA
ncbi:hypothetical protein CGC21_13095 [Leishmania donovani]|uniref:Uncharacterized protein n=1 Tax=Leishmania donovani TaxID=5661 RepID=A0A504XLH8_LEIDO|nr:hypothetical protein CGC21_13095 [Leishmania donovani]